MLGRFLRGPILAKFESKGDEKGNWSKKTEIEPEDVIALGAVLVAVITALGLVFGKVADATAIKIILGCVGAGGLSEVVKFGRRWLAKRKGV